MEHENSLPCSHDTCRILILSIFKNIQPFLMLYLGRMRHIYIATARDLCKLFLLMLEFICVATDITYVITVTSTHATVSVRHRSVVAT
jgi:hypothetical protein